MTLFLVVLFIVFCYVGYKFYYSIIDSQLVNEVVSDLFTEHDLPVLKEIPLFGNASIKLYGMKYKDEENGVFDDESWEYHRLVNMINKHINIDFIESEDGLEAEIELDDFRSHELRHEYMEIIGLVTNFNLAQFVFKGEEKFKTIDLNSKVIEQMKAHADEIIHTMFVETVRLLGDMSEHSMFEAFEG